MLSDSKLIFALQCCAHVDPMDCECSICPLYNDNACRKRLCLYAVEYIMSSKATSERLSSCVDDVSASLSKIHAMLSA